MENIRIYIALLIAAILISSCTSSVRFSSEKSIGASSVSKSGKSSSLSSDGDKTDYRVQGGDVFSGKASYYGEEFHGRKTASGEIYDRNKLSAANRDLPFGTKIKVRNLKNNKIVIVVINDRGPFKGSRILDLSAAAAEELDMLEDGVVDVEFEILDN